MNLQSILKKANAGFDYLITGMAATMIFANEIKSESSLERTFGDVLTVLSCGIMCLIKDRIMRTGQSANQSFLKGIILPYLSATGMLIACIAPIAVGYYTGNAFAAIALGIFSFNMAINISNDLANKFADTINNIEINIAKKFDGKSTEECKTNNFKAEEKVVKLEQQSMIKKWQELTRREQSQGNFAEVV